MNARPMIAGATAALSLAATVAAGLAGAIPTESVAGPLARIVEGFAPWLLALGLGLCILTALFGAWRTGIVLALAFAAASFVEISDYGELTQGSDPRLSSDLTVLFFNALAENDENGARIIAAATETGADILVFAEAAAIIDHLDTLREDYSFVSTCRGDVCELLMATNLPVLRDWQLQLNAAWAERYAVLEVDVPGHGSMFLAAGHLTKPWMSGLSEPELSQFTAQLNWLTGPSVVVGDFNMAPWSRPMRNLLRDTGFRAPRLGPGTWPSTASPALRLPIDHVLVRGGPTITSITPFGAGLGSNHLGILADIALP